MGEWPAHSDTLSAESPSVTAMQLPSVVAIDSYQTKTVGVERIRNNTLLSREAVALQYHFYASGFRQKFYARP